MRNSEYELEEEEIDMGPEPKQVRAKKGICLCGEPKMAFGKNKYCPICDESKIKKYSATMLDETKLIVNRIKKILKPRKKG